MFPSKFDWSREDCRGFLRHLELESYSKVISTFRAQGGLNDVKKKILEDLREVFHISQDRHRAEARRVANDEKLNTVAEIISGANTIQEWSIEGRRQFPLLPRQIPYTAFYSIANAMAEKAVQENLNLKSNYDILQNNNIKEIREEQNFAEVSIVKEDPAKLMLQEREDITHTLSLHEHLQNVTEVFLPNERRYTTNNQRKFEERNQNFSHYKFQELEHNHIKNVSRHKKLSSKRKNFLTNKEMVRQTSSPKTSQSNMKSTVFDNILESSTSESKYNINVPNPQTLHTYASLSQKKTPTHNSKSSNNETRYDNIDNLRLKTTRNSQAATYKKDVTNNLSKLSLCFLKKSLYDEVKIEKPQKLNVSEAHLKVGNNISNIVSSTLSNVNSNNNTPLTVTTASFPKTTNNKNQKMLIEERNLTNSKSPEHSKFKEDKDALTNFNEKKNDVSSESNINPLISQSNNTVFKSNSSNVQHKPVINKVQELSENQKK